MPLDDLAPREQMDTRRHVAHLVYRFATGGLENVVVQLVNNLPRDEFRHTVVSVTDMDPAFAQRVNRSDVKLVSLNKPPGQPFALYPKAYRLFRQLKPDVLHSCNLAALEFVPVAALARVPLRVHAEHGMDIAEIRGKGARYRTLRKFYKPFVHDYVAVSAPLHAYLKNSLGVAPAHLHLIPNGVDTTIFRPRQTSDPLPTSYPFRPGKHWVMGTVGRQVDIKNPLLLVDAFVSLVRSGVPGTERMRLAMVGDGPLSEPIRERMRQAGLEDHLWLPGVRSDVAEILRVLDAFVLPSLSEATSCTLQEAMASGLPIVTTDVGGNAHLLEHGACGSLVPSQDMQALATQILQHFQRGSDNPQAAAALVSVRRRYGLPAVMQQYGDLFRIQ